MAGTVSNTALWGNADVYVAPASSLGPINVVQAYAAPWVAVGLLDGDEGFTMSQENETSDHYAWGGLLVRRTRSKHKRTIKFVCLEENAAVFGIVNPGSATPTSAAGLTTRTVKVPTNPEIALSFEVRDGYNVKRRTVKRCQVSEVGEVKDSEADLLAYEITVTLLPESDGTLFVELQGVNGS